MKLEPLTPIEKLAANLDKLETAYPGYHYIYYKNLVKQSVSAFDSYGWLKYVLFSPKYHQLIKRARTALGQQNWQEVKTT